MEPFINQLNLEQNIDQLHTQSFNTRHFHQVSIHKTSVIFQVDEDSLSGEETGFSQAQILVQGVNLSPRKVRHHLVLVGAVSLAGDEEEERSDFGIHWLGPAVSRSIRPPD